MVVVVLSDFMVERVIGVNAGWCKICLANSGAVKVFCEKAAWCRCCWVQQVFGANAVWCKSCLV